MEKGQERKMLERNTNMGNPGDLWILVVSCIICQYYDAFVKERGEQNRYILKGKSERISSYFKFQISH